MSMESEFTGDPRAAPEVGRPEAGSAGVTVPGPTIEGLYRDHFHDVYRIVGRLLGPGASAADLEDLTQQVFISAHRGLSTFRGQSKPLTWLFGIAHNHVLAFLRSRARRRRLEAAVAREPAPLGEATLDTAVADRQRLLLVWRCLLRLPEKRRLVYLMHATEGLSGGEIAAALGVPEATVWTRLREARLELCAELKRAKVE